MKPTKGQIIYISFVKDVRQARENYIQLLIYNCLFTDKRSLSEKTELKDR